MFSCFCKRRKNENENEEEEERVTTTIHDPPTTVAADDDGSSSLSVLSSTPELLRQSMIVVNVWATAATPDGRYAIHASEGSRVFLEDTIDGGVVDLSRYRITAKAQNRL